MSRTILPFFLRIIRCALWLAAVCGAVVCSGQAEEGATTFHIPDGDVPALVAALETAGDGDTISLAAEGTYLLTGANNHYNGPNGLPVIADAITIQGNSATIERDPAAPPFRILYLNGVGRGTRLFNLTIKGGKASVSGGGLYNWNSSPVIINCVFEDNQAEDSGGGMFNMFNSQPWVQDSRFESNRAGYGGGMANLAGSHAILNDCIFVDNRSWWGAGIFNRSSSPEISDTLFQSNWAMDDDFDNGGGGGMANVDNSNPVISGSVFQGNDADLGVGGGMYNRNSNPRITNSVFELNWADPMGGGIYNSRSSPIIEDTVFERNWAANRGGAIANLANSNPVLKNLLLNRNGVNDHGGGMYNLESSPVVTGCYFIENLGDDSGGMANFNSNPFVRDSLFEGNGGAEWGGGMFNRNSSPRVENTVFRRNRAWEGGGMYNEESQPVLVECVFEGNVAEDDGGGIFNWASAPVITGSFFNGNSTGGSGGGMSNFLGSQPTVVDSVFDGNLALEGGGIFSAAGSSTEIESTFFCRNEPDPVAGPWDDGGGNEFCEESVSETYADWVRIQFSVSEWDDETVAGPHANPAGDGIANLLKYALGLDPWQATGTALPLPALQVFPEEGGGAFLTLVFAHPSSRTDIDYQVQLSSDLHDWTEEAVLVSSDDDGNQTFLVFRDTQPHDSAERRFMRLVVERF